MKISTKTKKYITSTVISFLAAFGLSLLAQWDNLGLEAVKNGSWVAVLYTAMRAGVKGLIESFLAWKAKRK